MKFRNQFLKYKLHSNTDDGAGGGGGNTDAGKSDENNTENNLLSDGALWDDTPNPSPDAGAQQQQQVTAPQQQQAPLDPTAKFQQHIDSLDFMSGLNPETMMTALRDGNVEDFAKSIKQIGVNAYRNAMMDTNTVVQQRVDAMGTAVRSDVATNNEDTAILAAMHGSLPYTKSPTFAPVANVVLKQLMSKGLNQQDAIVKVGEYFTNLSGEVSKLNPQAPNSSPAGNGFGNANQQQAGTNADDTDWNDFFGAPPAK